MPEITIRVLWADDEIDLLRPHILYLQSKGYQVTGVPNGEDAVALVSKEKFDVVLLDEMMPGIGGLATLAAIKEIDPSLQIVMITKSEEERLMNEALGKRISDYT
jgi:CheY-like chemotaxis protein